MGDTDLPGPAAGSPPTHGGGELALPDDDVIVGIPVDEPAETPQRPVYVLQVINVVVSVPRATVHHAVRVPAAGLVIAWRKWLAARSLSADFGQLAKAQGDHDKGLLWAQQAELERRGRSERRNGFIESVVQLVRLSPFLLAIWLFLMILTGICLAAAHHRPADLLAPWKALADTVAFAWSAATVLLWVLAYAVPVALFTAFYLLGRRPSAHAPGWGTAAKPGEEDRGLVVTADTIVLALQHLDKIAALKKAFGTGWQPSFTLQPVRDGRGYEAEFSIPLGVTAEMIADQRPVLARNLHREEIETWPSAGKPGYARLWVADPGAISKTAPEYPLLHEGEADVFAGVPGGVLARGDEALIPVVGANGDLGGLMGQGKSNAGRVIVLGCCTDPICGASVFVFANNGDFDAYEPRLAVYRKGLDDDVIEAAVEQLQQDYRDVGDREQMLADLGAKKVTRQLAQRYPELRPHVTLYSECHELFGHPEYGELAGELAVKIVKRQRKTGRAAWFDTQSSRKAAIPPALVELVSVNCCFAVKSWRSNDGFLGDGSFAAGIRATELRPGRDRGTSLVTGISDAQFELLKWYFVPVDDDTGYDAAAEVIARCMRTVDLRTPVAANSAPVAIVSRDLLTDLAEVIDGPDRVRLADLPPRLRKLAPAWLPYRGLDGVQLAALLDREGVTWVKPKNVPQLDPAELDKALRRREEEVS